MRIAVAQGIWLIADWLEDVRERLLNAAGKVAGL